ncbi:MAG: hypothetical protein IMZ61_12985 [Planctomycetes bacterium]|nr:hypothetical protein [Planctomycetota bacterium]
MICQLQGTVTGSEVTKSGKGSMIGILQTVNGKQAWVRVYSEKPVPKAGEKVDMAVRVGGKDWMVSVL